MRLSSLFLGLALFAPITGPVLAQVVGQGSTVRHHRETVDDDAAQQVTQAEQAIAKNDFPGAEKILLEVTGKDPKNYVAWFDLGYIYNATDRSAQSIDAYRKSISANPEIFESNLNLGIMLAREHNPDAENFLRAATKLKPTAHPEEGWFRAWLMLGNVLANSKPDEAIVAFRNAAKYHPKDPEPYLSAGRLLENQKQYAQAAAEYQKAAQLDPKSKEALAGLVNSYSEAKQVPEAEKAIRKFLELDPNNATAHVQLGRLLAAQQKWADAATELEAGLKLQPGDKEAEGQLADIYMQQKKPDLAVPYLQEALQRNPNDAALHHTLAQAYIEQKKLPEAQKELVATISLDPTMGEAYGDLAFVASENKDYMLVLKALAARSQLVPDNATTYFLRATAYDHLHDAKDAAENYHKFLEVANGRFPDQEWQAKHRLIAIEPKK